MTTAVIKTDADPYQAILRKTFELTYRCNFKCLHCFNRNHPAEGELTQTEIERVLDELAAAGTLYLTFTGGEILLRPDFLPILRAARRRNFALRLLTNGALLTPTLADEIAALGVAGVDISLHTLDPTIHDHLTGAPGTHPAVLAAIAACRARGIPLNIKFILTRHNQGEYDRVAEYAAACGARVVMDYVLVPADDGAPVMARHGLNEAEISAFIAAHAARPPVALSLPNGNDPICGAGANACCINPYGEVFPCLALRRSVGNLRNRSFMNIWHGPALDSIRNTTYSSFVECNGCRDAVFCMRCPGVALAETGQTTGRAPTICQAARAAHAAAEQIQQ